MRIAFSERVVQLVSAAAAIALTIVLAAQSTWPFDASRPKLRSSPAAGG